MSQMLGGTDAMMGAMFQATLCEEYRNVGRNDSLRWNYRRRSLSTAYSRLRFMTRWPSGSFMSGDPSVPLSITGDRIRAGNERNAVRIPGRGSHSLKFIMGQCVDSGGTAVPGAVVQGFRTSDDLFVRQTACDDKGNYELGTEYPGVAHYLVAYLDTTTDLAGTTVNTLTPTNRDGT